MNISKDESNYINLLRLILIIGVVLTHTVINVPQPHNFNNLTYNFIFFQQAVLGEFRVPTFFLLSGYFFYKNKEFNLSLFKIKVKSKINSLIIPYILWSSLALFLHILYDLFKKNNIDLLNPILAIKSFLYYKGDLIHPFPINGPLWYIRDLIFIILLSPIIYKIIKALKSYLIIILLLLFIVLPYTYLPFSLFFTGLIWFSVGAYLSINNITISNVLSKYDFVFIVYPLLIIVNLIVREIDGYQYIMQCLIICGVIFNAKFWWIIYNKFFKREIDTSKYVMFIYCSHFIVDYIKPFCRNLIKIENLTIQYILISCLTFGICSILYYIVKSSNKKLFKILIGNR